MEIIDKTISFPRGDYETIFVSVTEGRELIKFEEGDEVKFTVKHDVNARIPLIEKVVTSFINEKLAFEIKHEDTKKLDYREYVYDVRLFKSGRPYKTIVNYSPFILTGEVSYG